MEYPELIRFFAENKVAGIQSVREYVAYCGRNVDAVGFRAARDQTEMAKKAIEDRLDKQPSAADQIRQALRLLAAQRRLDFERYYNLIITAYKSSWSQGQQDYFEHATKIIRSGNYFFLSFTDRGPEGLGDKAVNRRYWYFIRPMVTQATKGDRRERNLLADAIDIMLRDASPEGFYYKRHDKDNSVVERKLREACESCLVFVQLVDNAMFEPPKVPNYCEFEYRHALGFIGQTANWVDDRVVFVVTETGLMDLPDPQTVHATYSDWVAHIRSKAAIYLPPVPSYDKQTIDKIRSSLTVVVQAVKTARDNMFDRVPS